MRTDCGTDHDVSVRRASDILKTQIHIDDGDFSERDVLLAVTYVRGPEAASSEGAVSLDAADESSVASQSVTLNGDASECGETVASGRNTLDVSATARLPRAGGPNTATARPTPTPSP